MLVCGRYDQGFKGSAVKTVKIVTFVASAIGMPEMHKNLQFLIISLLIRGSKWGVNENLRNNKEAGSPEQQYTRDNAQLSAPAWRW